MAALRAAVRAAYAVSERDVLQMRTLQNNVAVLAVERRSQREETERKAARELVHQIEAAWTELLRQGMDQGVFARRGDPHTLALTMLGMVVSVWAVVPPPGLRDAVGPERPGRGLLRSHGDAVSRPASASAERSCAGARLERYPAPAHCLCVNREVPSN